MRVARIEYDGQTDYAAAGPDSGWVPLSSAGLEPRNTGELVSLFPEIRAILESGDQTPIEPDRFLCPIVQPTQSLGIGRNYGRHVKEGGFEPPAEPVLFSKLPSALNGPTDDIVIETGLTSQVDWEVELVLLFGEVGRRVPESDWQRCIIGYLVGNDVSARDCQKRDRQYALAKGMRTFGPLGPWITTADEIEDPNQLNLSTHINGVQRQSANTSQMIFDVPYLVSYLSNAIEIYPGDLLFTGSPEGVARALPDKPFLKAGDIVRCEIEGLGSLENPVSHASDD